MPVMRAISDALAWLGRKGTAALAIILVIGIFVPPLGRVLKPYIGEAVFVLLCIAFCRVDTTALRFYLRRPKIVLTATAWTALVIPILVGTACLALGLEQRAPELMLALMLQAVAPPIMSAPAFAALMGLDATLVLITLVSSTAAAPFAAALFAQIFLDGGASIAPFELGLRLFGILAGSALVAVIVRRFVTAEKIRRASDQLDGVNILVLFIFVAGIMENVLASFLDRPLQTAGLLGLVFALFLIVLVATRLVFAWTGRDRAFALGFMASQRNMGVMLAATGGALPELTWLYFALAQFPIYLSPHLLKPFVRRRSAKQPGGT